MERRVNELQSLVELYWNWIEKLHPFDNFAQSLVAIEWYRVIRYIDQFLVSHQSEMHLAVSIFGLQKILSDEADRLKALKFAPSQYTVWQSAGDAVITIG